MPPRSSHEIFLAHRSGYSQSPWVSAVSFFSRDLLSTVQAIPKAHVGNRQTLSLLPATHEDVLPPSLGLSLRIHILNIHHNLVESDFHTRILIVYQRDILRVHSRFLS